MEKKVQKNIKGIRVTNPKYLETHSGVAFTADVLLEGKKVGFVENEGRGGCNTLYVESAHREEVHKRMHAYMEEEKVELWDSEESIFAEHLMDILEHGKVLTDKEKEAIVLSLNE